jgi:hypothetical protein
MASSATPAFLARLIEKHRPTVLIDEYDATVKGVRPWPKRCADN